MASLTLSVGALTASIETTNAKANTLLTEFVAATGGPTEGTNQEKADYVISMLRKYLVDKAKDARRANLRVAADAANEAEIAGLDW